MPGAAVVEVPVDIGRTEVNVPRVARVVRIEGRGPVVAEGPHTAKAGIEPVAGSGQEYAVSICTGNQISVYAILGGPPP